MKNEKFVNYCEYCKKDTVQTALVSPHYAKGEFEEEYAEAILQCDICCTINKVTTQKYLKPEEISNTIDESFKAKR